MSLDPQEVHTNLMRSLPVRTVICIDHDDDEIEESAPAPVRNGTHAGVAKMMSRIKGGAWYSAKHLAALAGMNEKAFYTHVRRMVQRKQLVRAGSRHSFRYRKA